MKTVYLVQHGSTYSNDPFEPECVCATEEQAKTFKARQEFSNLYHIKPMPYIDNSYQEEFDYILEQIESSDSLDEMVVMQQLRCLWTAYCFHNNLDVDTAGYDNRMMEMWNVMQENESAPYSSLEYERFYNAMSKYLV